MFRYTSTPPEGQFPMQNAGAVKFEAPKVPVIFILGKQRASSLILFSLHRMRVAIFNDRHCRCSGRAEIVLDGHLSRQLSPCVASGYLVMSANIVWY